MKLFPSLLAADFCCLEKSIEPLVKSGIEDFHLDVMDGHFVPNISYGPPVVGDILGRFSNLNWDAHLMMENPRLLFETFLELGVDCISIHVEIEPQLDYFKELAENYDSKLGLVINPATPVEPHARKISRADYVLLMSVQPGFGGQEFQNDVLNKVSKIRKYNSCPLQIDGGINQTTIPEVARTEIDWFVAGSAVFSAGDSVKAANQLKNLAKRNQK
ncbi:MAG: ribulose-phosphate 3-epimerase [bacterium]